MTEPGYLKFLVRASKGKRSISQEKTKLSKPSKLKAKAVPVLVLTVPGIPLYRILLCRVIFEYFGFYE
jgi:hypothetical protein